MYAQASTANLLGRRPWNSRLQGLSYYQRDNFVVPSITPGYSIGPPGSDQVTGGLGFDISTVTSSPWLLPVVGGAFLIWALLPSKHHRKGWRAEKRHQRGGLRFWE